MDPDEPHTALYIDEEGRALQKSDAVFALTKTVGGPARALLLARILPRPLRDRIYNRIAASRYALFDQTDACYLPSPEVRNRFTLPGD